MTDCPSTLGLMMRPAARIIRELPPRRSHTVSRFSSERPHLRPLLSCGVRRGERVNPSRSHEAVFVQQTERLSTALTRCTAWIQNEKKPLEKTPGEKPIALWAISAPNGAGVLSNGFRFVGISPPTEQTLSQLIGVCTTPAKKIGGNRESPVRQRWQPLLNHQHGWRL